MIEDVARAAMSWGRHWDDTEQLEAEDHDEAVDYFIQNYKSRTLTSYVEVSNQLVDKMSDWTEPVEVKFDRRPGLDVEMSVRYTEEGLQVRQLRQALQGVYDMLPRYSCQSDAPDGCPVCVARELLRAETRP